MTMTFDRLTVSLLTLRLSIFMVMMIWTVDKIINPTHALKVYSTFYSINTTDTVMSMLAIAEALLLIAFLFGIKRFLSYGLVFVLHGVSTLSSWQHYLAPFEGSNLLFFAAWPMLAGCLVLFLYRDSDQLLTLSRLS